MEEVFELDHAVESAAVQHIVDGLMEEFLSDITHLDEETHRKTTQLIWKRLENCGSPNISLSLEELQAQGVKTFKEQDHLIAALQYGRLKRQWIHQSVHTRWILSGNDHNRKRHRRMAAQRGPMKSTAQKSQKKRKETPKMIEIQEDTIIPQHIEAIELLPSDLKPHEVIMPQLKNLIKDLVYKLLQRGFEVHEDIQYWHLIPQIGDTEELIRKMTESILPEFLHLEGQSVTRQRLDDIFDKQGSPTEWPFARGYLLYVTSHESTEFWRPYIGQACSRTARIGQHCASIKHNSQTQLVYWVATRANRVIRFLRVWDTPDFVQQNAPKRQIFENLMETAMSLAFKTLQLDQLREYLGCGDHSIRGLNVMSPLLQSIYLTDYTRTEARKSLKDSHDPEIRQYNAFRVQQLQKEAASKPMPSDKQPTSCDTLAALSHAIPNHLRESLKGLATAGAQGPANTNPRHNDNSEAIFGSRQACIGIVLDDDIFAIGSPDESDFPKWVPKILGMIGFTRDNLRVWAWDFGSKTDLRQLDVQEENLEFHQKNQDAIKESGLRVIILGGKDAERVVTAPLKLPKIKIEVGKLYIEGFLETQNDVILRLYLVPGVPLSSISLRDHAPSAKACLAIKIAALLTEAQGIRPQLFRSRIAVGEIVLLRSREIDEGISLGPESLSPVVWAWLYKAGFQRSDLGLIQAIGGSSVSRGILLAMCTAPTCPPNYRRKAMEPIPHKNYGLHEKFSPYQLHAMKSFHERLADRRDAPAKPWAHGNQDTDEDGDLLTSDEVGEVEQCNVLAMIAKECLKE